MSLRRIAPLVALLVFAACGSDGAPARSAPSAAAGAATGATASATSRHVHLVRVGRFDSPDYITAPPGDRSRVFVVEQTGRIRVIRRGRVLRIPFLDLSRQVSCCGEQGVLSMAFAPNYSRSRRFYVDYTDRGGTTRVVEYRRSARSPDRALASTRRLVLSQPQPESNHNGGQLQFGADRLLYIGLGDGGGHDDQHGARGNGQDRSTLLGKILRIDPRHSGARRYTVPRSNPFVGRRGARPEIYAYGLRNPWRFSFDRRTGALVIGDVGQARHEEIDYARRGHARGANYGWRVFEGRSVHSPGERAPGAVAPVLTYPHTRGRCSITGGYVVRDRSLGSLYGRYIYGDYCAGDLRSVALSTGHARGDRGLGLHVAQLTSFGEDARGRVYASSQGGSVYRLAR